MIELIATLVRSYEQATGEHPDRIVCCHAMHREIVKVVNPNLFNAVSAAQMEDTMVVELYGLQVTPKHDVHPGLIMVCRAEDEHGYRPMAHMILG